MARELMATGVPIVELRAVVDLNLPTVYCDDAAIGDLAIRHFRERGFSQFAFCGRTGMRWSDLRERAYRQRLAELGYPCQVYTRRATGAGG